MFRGYVSGVCLGYGLGARIWGFGFGVRGLGSSVVPFYPFWVLGSSIQGMYTKNDANCFSMVTTRLPSE